MRRVQQLPSPPAEDQDVSKADTVETTRIFVSGLPPKFTSDQLATHFGAQFKVTDAHVIADRRIGFVGFQDSIAAQNAVKHFNKSYIRLSKIAVELARPVELGNGVPVSQRKQGNVVDGGNRKRKRSREDDGEVERGDTKEVVQVVGDEDGQIGEGKDDEGNAGAATDNDWLRRKTKRTLDLIDPDEIQIMQDDDDDEENKNSKVHAEKQSEEAQAEAEAENKVEVPNARLFLRNLAFSVTESGLEQLFKAHGKVQEVHLVKDAKSSSRKGTAFIQFAEPREAEAALRALDGTTVQGRLLHILPAANKRDQGLTEYDISQMPLKKQKAVRRKLEASKATFSWNSLYMNPDAVLSSIADRLGVAKTDILDPTSADAAVKQAHAETQLIKETKQYFTSAGVNVDAFKNQSRHDRCLLLKNFPYGTTEGELRTLLEPFGAISRFLLPPSGTMALVQFEDAFSASEALKNLAYKNIKGSVLYLEKAPQGILDAPVELTNPETEAKAPNQEPEATAGTTSTVFVKNLNFSTNSARLKDVASSLPGFVSARVKTRTDPKRSGEILSMGFGFIEFRSKKDAESAVGALNGHQLDGHELKVQLSSKALDAGEETRRQDQKRKKDANQTKIIIKNLPFQASKKDVRSLFAQYGELKKVRVPRKFDNTTRGFAFAEFVTPKEAENAMDALGNTHLLGRRLVLEFAEGDAVDAEEEIRAIEKKVEQQSRRVHYNNLTGPGRRKFHLDAAREDGLDS